MKRDNRRRIPGRRVATALTTTQLRDVVSGASGDFGSSGRIHSLCTKTDKGYTVSPPNTVGGTED
jgi:hypothetical protein